MALFALEAKGLLLHYMLAVAKRIRSSLLITKAWHALSYRSAKNHNPGQRINTGSYVTWVEENQ